MLEPQEIDWEEKFTKSPDRYLKVFDNDTGEIIEVHDKKTGEIWFRVNDKWMVMK